MEKRFPRREGTATSRLIICLADKDIYIRSVCIERVTFIELYFAGNLKKKYYFASLALFMSSSWCALADFSSGITILLITCIVTQCFAFIVRETLVTGSKTTGISYKQIRCGNDVPTDRIFVHIILKKRKMVPAFEGANVTTVGC